MFFTLKKIVGGLLLPLPLLLLLMAAGILLLWFTRWQKSGKTLVSAAWVILFALSLQPVADSLLRPLERQYPTRNAAANIRYIVVLGGGYTWNSKWAPSSNLISNSLSRVTEGVRQWRLNPGARLIFTGGAAETNPVSNAEAAAAVALSLGVPEQDIIRLDWPRDTDDEARAVKKMVGEQAFLLVTSANHMPRAMAFFRHQGLAPLATPANQMAIESALNWWEKALPAPLWLSHSDRAVYEGIGTIWQKLNGKNSIGKEEAR
ncbi:envelope biogenesis factor ElyC [Mixta tenebrionis]|uniref:Envelope biogenesis factor ElyC n=1 Tax=Mixta tenebrionis TaxID=2562439 RepID=A0A506VGL5_9GAMM|nr:MULTISPECIES: envelope biogenesis factor ElyC [Mixta]QHM76029.1 hypothetical protein C7M52_01992 [Mixta theicola]TPW44556.1 envelope biogenesis factor ElyC [Mixta tenebrionis]